MFSETVSQVPTLKLIFHGTVVTKKNKYALLRPDVNVIKHFYLSLVQKQIS